MVACVFALGGLLLGDYLCGVSWCWASISLYGDSDIIGFYYSDIKNSGKFGIIRVSIPVLACALLTISIFNRIEAYCFCCFYFTSRAYRYEDRAE